MEGQLTTYGIGGEHTDGLGTHPNSIGYVLRLGHASWGRLLRRHSGDLLDIYGDRRASVGISVISGCGGGRSYGIHSVRG